MQKPETRVLVVHRCREFARRLHEQASNLPEIDLKFVDASGRLSSQLSNAGSDLIIFDLSSLVPRNFTIYQILESRTPSVPPLVILRTLDDKPAGRRNEDRRRASQGIERLEAGLQVTLGRTPHQFSWLPVQFTGKHLTADLPNTHVVVDGKRVSISAREGEVLGLLLTNCNQLVRRELLFSEIWGYETRSLDVHVRRIRQKLGTAGTQVETVKAFGYRFVEPRSDTDRRPGPIRPSDTYTSPGARTAHLASAEARETPSAAWHTPTQFHEEYA